MTQPRHDLLIVGGGPVGASLAIALAGSGLDVALLESRADVSSSRDDRTLAISYGTRLILERLGIWEAAGTATPINTIHVSQRGGFGRSLLVAEEIGLPALGYVLRYAALQQSLGKALAKAPQVRLLSGAQVETVVQEPDAVSIRYAQNGQSQSVSARLLVIADGGVGLAQQAGAIIKSRDYEQQAVVGLIETSRPHGFCAFERFTGDGPVALLPFENRHALIWTAGPDAASRLVCLPEDEFLGSLQQHFGDRAGRFLSIGARSRFPLSLRYALDPVLPRTVLLGNAAQALHPIAGQGFNLGLRDAWELGEVIRSAGTADPGADASLSRYRSIRKLDRMSGIALTDSLVRIFSNDVGPLRALRGGGLAILDLMPAAKRAFVQRMIFGGAL
jgi:2-octaprenyl-6-methoxyphenol hydroxylase